MARVEQSIEVNVPVRTAYNQLTQFEEFPRFMEGVHSVRQLDDAHLHWRAEKGGREMEWDAEITRQIPDQCIAWRNTSGPKNEGEVRFDPIESGKTRITLVMEAEDQFLKHPERIGDATPKADQDLARFKKLIESQQQASGEWRGEIRNGQRVDQTEPAGPETGGSVTGQTMEDALEQIDEEPDTGESITEVPIAFTRLAERQSRAMELSWPAQQPWVPDLMGFWERQMSMFLLMSRQMERLFADWMRLPTQSPLPGQPDAASAERWAPPIELAERDGALIVSADLPGVGKEDVQVAVAGDQLIIEGARRARAAQPMRHGERNYGRFYREIALPGDVDSSAGQAMMRDGVLEVVLPIQAGRRATRRLEVQAGGR